jgi:phage terminase small subunit
MLTKKQQAFIEYYLQSFNATEAAIKAGYSERSAYSIGSENLSKPEIKAAVESRLNELKMSADEALVMLAEIARSSMADFAEIDKNGKPKIKMKSEKLHLVKKLAIKPTEFGMSYEFELYDRMAALQLIGKHHKLFSEKLVIEDWRSQAIADIRAGKLDYQVLAETFDESLAAELFRAAGVPITS